MNKTRLFILATCRKPELLPAATLVFDTIRTGFPNADIIVFDNGNKDEFKDAIREKVKAVKGQLVHIPERVIHHQWIEGITETNMDERTEPFYCVDTDMVFWKSCEGWDFGTASMAGRYIPGFRDGFTKCWTLPRLHPSLLYINPQRLRASLVEFRRQFPASDFNPMANPYYPIHMPPADFYDTMAVMYRMLQERETESFDQGHLDHYDHLFCGSCVDIVGPHLSDGKMQERHAELIKNPSAMKGLWKKQDAYFKYQGT